MAVFDKAKPSGQSPIAQGDDAIRENNEAIQEALNTEHVFNDADGANQSGRHTFANGLTGDQGAIVFPDIDLFFLKDPTERPGKFILQVSQAASVNENIASGPGWVNVDVNPLNFVDFKPTLPRVNENSEFTVAQLAEWQDFIVAGVNPLDPTISAFQKLTISAPINFGQPNALPAGYGSIITLDLAQNNPGLHAVTFDPVWFVAPNQLAPIATGPDEHTLITFTYLDSGKVLVTTVPNFNQTGVTT